jgi:Tol biopolymer transport system component
MMSDRSRDDIDRLLTGWMDAEARLAPPDGLVDRAVARTRSARRRSRWLLPEWWVPDRHVARAMAVWRVVPVVLLAMALVLLVALLVLVAGGQRSRVPAPFGLASNGRLVVDTNGSLLVADPSGGKPEPLVEGVRLAAGVTFSRDGARVAFWGDGSPDTLYIANADGSAVRQLAQNLWIGTDKSPTWSPDGRFIAISTESGPDRGDEFMLVVDAGSGAISRIAAPELDGTRAIVPAWSPDGAWIAFVGIARDDPSGQPAYWIVHPDGSSARKLPTSPLAPDVVIAPRWAPDPGHLRVAYSALDGADGSTAVTVLDVATAQETRLSPGKQSRFPAWSPDGSSLAWLTDDLGSIRIVPADVAGQARLIPRTGIAGPPAWSPDGREIYGLDEARSTLIVVTVDGSRPTVRIPHDASQGLPDWQRVTP